MTLLMKVARSGKADRIDRLLKAFPDIDLNVKTPAGDGAVHLAARKGCIQGQLRAMSLLLDKGAENDDHLQYILEHNKRRIQVQDTVKRLAKSFRSAERFQLITRARVPLFKFRHKDGLDCDVSVSNRLALCNTRLLEAYCLLDERYRPLGYFLKKWCKAVGLHDASQGGFSSYAMTMMLLASLQQASPPVLPYLQQLASPACPKQQRLVDGYDAYFCTDLPYVQQTWRRTEVNTQTLAELVAGFFDFCATFPFEKRVMQVREGTVLFKADKDWDADIIAVEDPFDPTHNLTRTVSAPRTFDKFLRLCASGSRLVRTCIENKAPLPDLTSPDWRRGPVQKKTETESESETDSDSDSEPELGLEVETRNAK
ncbi:uncharacterized protein MONBRDRAFT_28850 [Monosiga brevicollis MX1]|uniref:PAP-associated domain-containing protein n=1 Tax=Monosiga brevicollis TaxID=81824 RepID=A9V988_MONBE|nr:uncharacterized protein MONBRDRAFT_28850 [Monosiga brevicollis MX1]EDQ85887.1 predicted protein [Monosiga brevicollis MX1]|eukprot:XP_001749366.1 hypothetical protein [Monosiga brevicollis MX1]